MKKFKNFEILLAVIGLVSFNFFLNGFSSIKSVFSKQQQEKSSQTQNNNKIVDKKDEFYQSDLKQTKRNEEITAAGETAENFSLFITSPANNSILKGKINIEIGVAENTNKIVKEIDIFVRKQDAPSYFLAQIRLNGKGKGGYLWETVSSPNGFYYLWAEVMGKKSPLILISLDNSIIEPDPVPSLEKKVEAKELKKGDDEKEDEKKIAEEIEELSKKIDEHGAPPSIQKKVKEIKEESLMKEQEKKTIFEEGIKEIIKETEKFETPQPVLEKINKIEKELVQNKQKQDSLKEEIKIINEKIDQRQKNQPIEIPKPESVLLPPENFKKFSPNDYLALDTDGDGLPDEEELIYGTDLSNPDTDGDGYLDGVEVENGYNPQGHGKLEKNSVLGIPAAFLQMAKIVKDSDNDGLTDPEEEFYGTNPDNPDSDGDGYFDGEEVRAGYDPLTPFQAGKIIYEEPTKAGPEKPEIYEVKKVENTIIKEGTLEKTEKKALIFQGKGIPNSFVVLYIYSEQPIVVVTKVDANGDWSYTLDKSLEDGEHKVYVAITNNTGKIAAKSKPYNFFIKEAKAVSESEYKAYIGVTEKSNTMLLKQFSIVFSVIIILIVLITLAYKKLSV